MRENRNNITLFLNSSSACDRSLSTAAIRSVLGLRTSQQGRAPIQTRRGGAPPPSADARLVFVVEAFRRTDGERLWKWELPAAGDIQPVHLKHNLATPSPVTDGERLVVWFGTGQVATLDLDGGLLWKRHLGEEYGPFEIRWAHGSSPVLYRDVVVFLCDHTPAAYLLALDKRTGDTRWKTDRGAPKRSYATPLVIKVPTPLGHRASPAWGRYSRQCIDCRISVPPRAQTQDRAPRQN